MTPAKVIAQALKMRRKQVGMNQSALADAVRDHGVTLDASAVNRIENLKRRVSVEELLALAAALDATPAHLLTPHYVRSLTVGENELTAGQVLAWFGGDPDAYRRPVKTFDELRDRRVSRRIVSDLVEEIELIDQALQRKDWNAAVWAALRTHNTLAAMVESLMPNEVLRKIWSDYGIEPDNEER